jgi:hypothetical protein
MGGVCSTHSTNAKFVKNSGPKTCRKDITQDLSVNGRIILKCIIGK